MTTAAEILSETPDDLRSWVLDMIRAQANSDPRSKQTALGPSQVGHPCDRKLALGLMREPKCNTGSDPWASVIGRAMHTWLEHAVQEQNSKLGRQRWLTENRVEPTTGLPGSADVFDTETGRVIDWKVVGTSRLAEYKRVGPSLQYQRQIMLYGKGFQNLGYDVREVAIVFLPRTGRLSQTYVWTSDYSEDIAAEVISRYQKMMVLLDMLGVEANPDMYQHIPITPDDLCGFCPWYNPVNPTATQCAGEIQE